MAAPVWRHGRNHYVLNASLGRSASAPPEGRPPTPLETGSDPSGKGRSPGGGKLDGERPIRQKSLPWGTNCI
ncbi:hypothetical protein NDU88_006788 [Pleurodeles waltl]|uniref:Uncharacterized protein n=1 Tax=Pleurodeles waltl TaxID=8319 RepID=A0AAV7X503_PLEWA|nr:hypothetical protein NDU88_006788 [Pleurodeles waltl]